MKKATGGIIAAAVAVLVAGTASAQSTGTYQYQVPSYGQTQAYQAPQAGTSYGAPAGTSYGAPAGTTYGAPAQTYGAPQAGVTYGAPSTTYGAPAQGGSITYGTLPSAGTYSGTSTGTTTYQSAPQTAGTVYQQPSYPVPQPYIPGAQQGFPQPTFPGFPTTGFPAPPPPVNPAPAPKRPEIEDTDAWTFAVARYYPAIKACLRNTSVKNPVIANVQERRNATVMLIGQGGTAEYSVCRTGLRGTKVRKGKQERGLPPAFYAPMGSSFTITPDRPFQPVVDTGQRLLGWIVRTTPVRLDVYGGGRGFDGQFIKPVTVNPDVQ